MYVLEISIVVKADDKLALEAVSEAIAHQVDVLAGEFETEFVSLPILEGAEYDKISSMFNRGLLTKAEADALKRVL